MHKKFALILTILFFLTGCQNSQDNIIVNPFEFMLLKASYEKNKSEIILFNKDWQITQKIPMNFGGLGGILQRKIKQYNNRIYIIALGATSNPFEKILEINIKSGATRFIDTGKFPTDLEVFNDKLYIVHNSSIDNSKVISIDLKSKKIIKRIELSGVLPAIAASSDGDLYITAENPPMGNQIIYKLDLDLNVKAKIVNNKTIGNTDFLFNDKKLMLFNKSNSNLHNPTLLFPSNRYLELDQENRENFIQLSKVSPYQAFDIGSSIIITHSSVSNQSGYVTRINKKTRKQEVFKLSSTVFNSDIQGNYLYVLGNAPDKGGSIENVYEYQLSDFTLKKVVKLPIDRDLVLSGIFINPINSNLK